MERINKTINSLQLKGTGRALSDEPAETIFSCRLCHDVHFVHPLKDNGRTDYAHVIPCACVKEQVEKDREQSLLHYCELPAGTEHMTFEGWDARPGLEEAHNVALELAEGSGVSWLTLMSGVNLGKTHLAVAICRRRLLAGKIARYAFVPLLLEELRRGFREGGDLAYEARFDRFLNVPLLVLDDLGVEHRTGWVQEKLETIVDYRLMHGLDLVVTTNTPIDELPFRITSRLKRAPGSRVVFIEAPEYKKKKVKR